jgi:dipeptidase E
MGVDAHAPSKAIIENAAKVARIIVSPVLRKVHRGLHHDQGSLWDEMMKLYLSSYRMGDSFDLLLSMLKSKARVAVISNALDFIPHDERLSYKMNVHDPIAVFQAHGVNAAELDLRVYFGAEAALQNALAPFDLVWAVGGNSFLLMRAMRASGFDHVIARRALQDDLIYGGWSAGAVAAGPTLRGLEVMDDPRVDAEGYQNAPLSWDGLGLIDVSIVPHFDSDHGDSEAAGQAVAAMRAQRIAHQALRDGEVITGETGSWVVRARAQGAIR